MASEDLAAIHAKLDELCEQIHRLTIAWPMHLARVERLEHEVFGNGHSGLAVRVRALLWLASGMAGMLTFVVAQIVVEWLR